MLGLGSLLPSRPFLRPVARWEPLRRSLDPRPAGDKGPELKGEALERPSYHRRQRLSALCVFFFLLFVHLAPLHEHIPPLVLPSPCDDGRRGSFRYAHGESKAKNVKRGRDARPKGARAKELHRRKKKNGDDDDAEPTAFLISSFRGLLALIRPPPSPLSRAQNNITDGRDPLEAEAGAEAAAAEVLVRWKMDRKGGDVESLMVATKNQRAGRSVGDASERRKKLNLLSWEKQQQQFRRCPHRAKLYQEAEAAEERERKWRWRRRR